MNNNQVEIIEDVNYLVQYERSNINLVVSQMMELLSYNEERYKELRNQNWVQRMCSTLSKKNSRIEQEIEKNHASIQSYIVKVIMELNNQNLIRDQVIVNLGLRINKLFQDNQDIRMMLGSFVQKLNEKIESVDNYHLLIEEIQHNVYDAYPPVVALYLIMGQIDKRSINDNRKMTILRKTLEEKGILTNQSVSISKLLLDFCNMDVDTASNIMIDSQTGIDDCIVSMIQKVCREYCFRPMLEKKLLNKEKLVANVLDSFDFNDVQITLDILFDTYAEGKSSVFNIDVSKKCIEKNSPVLIAQDLFMRAKYKEALDEIRSLSNDNNARATFILGLYYDNGYAGIEEDEDKYISLMEQAYEQGEVLAGLELGTGYEEYDDILETCIEASINLAENGDAIAQHIIAKYYMQKYYETESVIFVDKAIEWFKRAAESGYLASKYVLGTILIDSDDTVTIEEGKALLNEAADNGFVAALWKLSEMYQDGTVYEIDEYKAYQCMLQAFELTNGVEEEIELAFMLTYGIGVKENKTKAFSIYKKWSSKNATAMCRLGDCYKYETGCEKNSKQALQYYKKAADMGSLNALVYIAECYLYGEGTDVDYNTAFQILSSQETQDIPYAQFLLGKCYYLGWGTNRDVKLAFDCFWNAAYAEWSDAYWYLGKMSESFKEELGFSEKEASEEAFYWYYEAAESGDIEAMNKLSDFYSKGYGVERDSDKAEYWKNEYEKSL